MSTMAYCYTIYILIRCYFENVIVIYCLFIARVHCESLAACCMCVFHILRSVQFL